MNQKLRCDICLMPCKEMYDGKTTFGVWAFMCRYCFPVYGKGLGIGKGTKLNQENKEKKNG